MQQTSHYTLTKNETGRLRGIFYHYPEEMEAAHGNVTTLWKKYGYPQNLTREQQQSLSEYAGTLAKKELQADGDGTLHLDLTLSPWSIHFLSEAED